MLHLEDLDLSRNELGWGIGATMGARLPRSRRLKRLVLKRSGLVSYDAKSLGATIAQAPALEQLEIGAVAIQDQGARERCREHFAPRSVALDDPQPHVMVRIEQLRQAEGEVLVPYHGYLAVMAGKRGSAHHMAMADVERGSDPARRDELKAQYLKAIDNQRYSLILMSVRNWFSDEMADSYEEAVDLFPEEENDHFRPVAGKPPHRPRWIYRPR